MWNKPHLLNAIADLLMLVAGAAVLAAAAVWLVRVPSLPVRHVVFTEALPHTKRGEVEQVLPAALKGNFFSLNLDMVRGALEKLPWVRKVHVRRQWPDRLEVRIEEHKPVARWGEAIESNEQFPERVNVGFMQVLDEGHIRLRVYERGAGETQACGTGACAAVVAGVRLGLLQAASQIRVSLPGGDLHIEWQPGDDVMMTGPVQTVFEGELQY